MFSIINSVMAIPVAQKSQSEAQNKEEMKRVEKEGGGENRARWLIQKNARCHITFSYWKPVSDTEEKATAARWFDGYVWINVRWEGRLSRGRGISQNLGKKRPGLPGTPVERQKASISGSVTEELCPWARRNMSESELAVTLSFGDAIQLERLTMATLMALKLPLKMWKLSGLNNSRQSICDACHSTSSSHHSAEVCAAEVLTEWRSGGTRRMGGIAVVGLETRWVVHARPRWDIHHLEGVTHAPKKWVTVSN